MARLFADENFDFKIVEALRGLGHDVVRLQEIGLANKHLPDAMVLNRASDDARILLTHDRWDFIRLHRSGCSHAGIVAVKEDRDTEGMAERIHSLLSGDESLSGRLFRANRAPVGVVEESEESPA
jgi:predicted nuclease of predicted toxin-antitoxin system